jgi:hypothetical protein
VRIADATYVGGLEFTVSFDPDVVQVQSVDAGAFLGNSGRTAGTLGPVVDNVAGTVTFGGYTTGNASGAMGAGDVATLHFRTGDTGTIMLDAGTVTLAIQNPLVADTTGALSVPATTGAAVTVKPDILNVYLPLIMREN